MSNSKLPSGTTSLRRRSLLRTGAAAAGVTILRNGTTRAQAQNWPDRPVKLILPYAPGGATDLMGRPWAEKLSQAFGQQFVIENRGGAGGMIGTEAAAKSPPDGYTIFFAPGATLTVLPLLRKAPYDPVKSFTPIARAGDLVCGFAIQPSVGAKTFKETIDYARQNPGKLAYGSAGLGTSSQLRIEMLKYRAKVDILHVPYRGSADALNDLLSNNVQMMNEINLLPHVKTGKLILLNINYPTRHQDFPDVPILKELGYPELRRADLVLVPGARRHAETDHRQAARQDHRDRRHRRHEEAHAGDQRLGADPDAGGDDGASARRYQGDQRTDQRGERQAGIAATRTSTGPAVIQLRPRQRITEPALIVPESPIYDRGHRSPAGRQERVEGGATWAPSSSAWIQPQPGALLALSVVPWSRQA